MNQMKNLIAGLILSALLLIGFTPQQAEAVILCNNAWENTNTTGTGSLVVTGAVDGAQTFENCGITNSQSIRYRIFDGTAWELGTGTYTTGDNTLTRTVIESSNADAAISLSGTATVIIVPLTQDLPSESLAEVSVDDPTDEDVFLDNGALKRIDRKFAATGKQPVPLLASAGVIPSGGAIVGCSPISLFDSGSNDIFARQCSFSASTDNALQWMIPVPKGVSESTDLTARVDWTSTTTTDATDDVIWGMSCVAFSNDDAINGNAFPASDTVTDTQTAAGDFLSSSEITAITPAGTWTEGDMLVCQLTRDADAAGDNFNGTADLFNVMLYFTTNANTDE
jgi:hypothetical protein